MYHVALELSAEEVQGLKHTAVSLNMTVQALATKLVREGIQQINHTTKDKK